MGTGSTFHRIMDRECQAKWDTKMDMDSLIIALWWIDLGWDPLMHPMPTINNLIIKQIEVEWVKMHFLYPWQMTEIWHLECRWDSPNSISHHQWEVICTQLRISVALHEMTWWGIRIKTSEAMVSSLTTALKTITFLTNNSNIRCRCSVLQCRCKIRMDSRPAWGTWALGKCRQWQAEVKESWIISKSLSSLTISSIKDMAISQSSRVWTRLTMMQMSVCRRAITSRGRLDIRDSVMQIWGPKISGVLPPPRVNIQEIWPQIEEEITHSVMLKKQGEAWHFLRREYRTQGTEERRIWRLNMFHPGIWTQLGINISSICRWTISARVWLCSNRIISSAMCLDHLLKIWVTMIHRWWDSLKQHQLDQIGTIGKYSSQLCHLVQVLPWVKAKRARIAIIASTRRTQWPLEHHNNPKHLVRSEERLG